MVACFLGEEKKTLAPLLGKLYVSPTSTEDKLRDLYGEVSDAVDGQLLSDATSRNALYKLHVSLGKIVNNLDAAGDGMTVLGRRSTSRATSVSVLEDKTVLDDRTVMEDATVVPEPTIKEEEGEEEKEGEEEQGEDLDFDETADARSDGTVLHRDEGDSLVDDLLTDDGETRLEG
jgi:condensin complex subunit 3